MSCGFHIENFGCRAARADAEAIGHRLRAAQGQERDLPLADVVIVNTCSVTAEADREARAFIRRTHRQNPAARILVTGCYAQRAPQELSDLPGVAAVVGNSHKSLAPEIALGLAGSPAPSAPPPELVSVQSLLTGTPSSGAQVWVDDQFAHSFLEEAQLLPGLQTRPNLKIQEGCSNRCTFCVIPQTRGGSRSLPPAKILEQVRGFVAAGGNELVLSGINLGRWGRDLSAEAASIPFGSDHASALGPVTTLAALLRVLFETTGLPRLRLSSIEPMDWSTELIELMRQFGGSRLARHAHLPLQSGSDAVLRRMHRRYRPWHYVEKVEALLETVGSALTLGADVMVGFPGETDAEFEETRKLIDALPFGYLHLFPFSPRPNTRGWALHAASPVPGPVVQERLAALRELAHKKSFAHRAQFLNRTLPVICLHTPPTIAQRGRTVALAENFLPVEIAGVFPANHLCSVQITGVESDLVLSALPL